MNALSGPPGPSRTPDPPAEPAPFVPASRGGERRARALMRFTRQVVTFGLRYRWRELQLLAVPCAMALAAAWLSPAPLPTPAALAPAAILVGLLLAGNAGLSWLAPWADQHPLPLVALLLVSGFATTAAGAPEGVRPHLMGAVGAVLVVVGVATLPAAIDSILAGRAGGADDANGTRHLKPADHAWSGLAPLRGSRRSKVAPLPGAARRWTVTGMWPPPASPGGPRGDRQEDRSGDAGSGWAGWWRWSQREALPSRRAVALLLGVAAVSLAVTAWRRDLGLTLVALATLLTPLHVASGGGTYCVATATAVVALSVAGLGLGTPDGWPANPGQSGPPGPAGPTTGGTPLALPGQPGAEGAWQLAALGELFGLAGVGVALACYATLAVRGLRIAMLQRRDGHRLVAATAAAALASQAAVAAAASLALIPPTVVVAPFLAPFLWGAWFPSAADSIAVGVLLYISGAADRASAIGYGPAQGPGQAPP